MIESRQSYCHKHRVQFFLAHPVEQYSSEATSSGKNFSELLQDAAGVCGQSCKTLI